MLKLVNVRRLAAIDMYGVRGTARRRRIILVEFVAGVVAMVSIGGWMLTQSSETGGRLLGLWFIGAGLNYAPLAMYAIALSRSGALGAELADVDTHKELHRYGVLQLWILVPLSLVVLCARDVLQPTSRRFVGNGGRGGGGRGNGGGGNGAGTTLLTIQPSSSVTSANLPPLPGQLNSMERLDPASASVTRQMVLGGGRGRRTINGVSMQTMADMMDMSNVARVRLGDVERWNVVNQGGGTHLFHIHDVQFQILSRNGNAPAASELGRKDTVQVRSNETVALLMRFTDYADADTPYMYHCHILPHEDQGMMGQFLVVPA